MKSIGGIHSGARPEVGVRVTVPIGIAWAPRVGGKNYRPKTVIRAGFGVFNNRLALSNTLTLLRYNDVVQRQFVVANSQMIAADREVGGLSDRG